MSFAVFSTKYPPLVDPWSRISGSPMGQLRGGLLRGWVIHAKGLFPCDPNRDSFERWKSLGGGVGGVCPTLLFHYWDSIFVYGILSFFCASRRHWKCLRDWPPKRFAGDQIMFQSKTLRFEFILSQKKSRSALHRLFFTQIFCVQWYFFSPTRREEGGAEFPPSDGGGVEGGVQTPPPRSQESPGPN